MSDDKPLVCQFWRWGDGRLVEVTVSRDIQVVQRGPALSEEEANRLAEEVEGGQ